MIINIRFENIDKIYNELMFKENNSYHYYCFLMKMIDILNITSNSYA